MSNLKLSSLIKLFLISIVVGNSIAYSKFYFYHAIVSVLLLVFLYKLSNKELLLTGNFTIKASLLFLIFTVFWYSTSILWSLNKFYTFRYLFYLVACSSIPFFLVLYVNSPARFFGSYKILKYCFLAEICVAIVEIAFGFHLPTSPYSGFSHFFGRPGTDFGQFSADTVLLIKHVPTGFHHNPNNLALVFGCLIPFFLFQKSKLKVVFGTSFMLFLILACGSRGVFLASIIGITLFFVVYGSKISLFTLMVGLFIFAFCINQFHFIELLGLDQVNSAFKALEYYLDWNYSGSGSIAARHELIRNGLVALRGSYGLGVGGGSSLAVQEMSAGEIGDLGSMHNFWVEVLVEAGIVYFVVFFLWYCFLASRLFWLSKTSSSLSLRYHSGALFLSFFIFGVGCISASTVIYHFPMWLMFGWALLVIKLSKQLEFTCTRRVRCI